MDGIKTENSWADEEGAEELVEPGAEEEVEQRAEEEVEQDTGK